MLGSRLDCPNKQPLERYVFGEPGGRLMTAPPRFFSNLAWGPPPWRWGSEPHDQIEVWRIQ